MDPKHERAIDLLLAGRTPSEVGAELDVCRETVWRWTKDPDIAAALTRRRAEVCKATTDALTDGALEAVRVLREAMGPGAPWPVRLRAAVALLDRAVHLPTDDALSASPWDRPYVDRSDDGWCTP